MACRTAREVLDSAEDTADKPLASAALSQLRAVVRLPQLPSLRTCLLFHVLPAHGPLMDADPSYALCLMLKSCSCICCELLPGSGLP